MKTSRSLPSQAPQRPLEKQQGKPMRQTSGGGSADGPGSKNRFQSGFEPARPGNHKGPQSAPPNAGLAARGLDARQSNTRSVPDQDPSGETKPPQRGSGQGSDDGNRAVQIE